MLYWGYNDYELLYLAKEKNEEAIDIIFDKYSNFIIKKAYGFQSILNFDDLCQEGKMVLSKAIQNFDEIYNKTFTRYFEMLINHRFIDLARVKQREKRVLEFNDDIVNNYQMNFHNKVDQLVLREAVEINYQKLSAFEKKVFVYKYFSNMKVLEISNKLQTNPINISNALQRIKRKLKNNFLK